MVAKILSSSSSFNGVSYNTNKAQKDLGELMMVKNFGYLQNATAIMPEEYKNYLKAFSATNTRVKDKQFHAVISCEGKKFDKHKLKQVAEAWLNEMGYANNPFLIVYHNDTNNNHVHIVSTRINSDGKKVNDSFEKKRAMAALQKIMQTDVKQVANQDIAEALKFNMSSLAQYKLILEKKGYVILEKGGLLTLRKFDDIQATVPIDKVMKQISLSDKSENRISQLRAIFEKYRSIHSPEIKILYKPTTNKSLKTPIGYTSDLAIFLKDKFGLDIIFHGKEGKAPYGYTIIDHANKNIFKGGEIMPLKEFIQKIKSEQNDSSEVLADHLDIKVNDLYEKQAAKSICNESNLKITAKEKDVGVRDPIKRDQNIIIEPFQSKQEYEETYRQSTCEGFELNISDDIDDEQINGRNRRREKKARVNTR